MKRMKRLLGVLLLISLIIGNANLSYASDLCIKEYDMERIIPAEVDTFVNLQYKEIVEASLSYYPELLSKNVSDYRLGKPFTIYDSNTNNSKALYYYPVILKGNVVLVVSAIKTSFGVTVSASNELVKELNVIHYNNNDIVFFEYGTDIFAESQNGKIRIGNIGSGDSVKNEMFFEESFEEKKLQIARSFMQKDIIDISAVRGFADKKEDAYSPSLSTSTSSSKICSLYNAQSQGNLPICWAASVATIVNYRKGTSYTAKDVCDKEGTGYVGANIDTKKDALKDYGITYKKTTSQLSLSKVIKNIEKKYPIAASTFDSAGNGHAVTVYGYKTVKVNDYIIIWNSGTGATQTIYYNPNGSTFSYNNTVWTWTSSLSYYD